MQFVQWLYADRHEAEGIECSDTERYKWGGANGLQNSSIAGFLESAIAGAEAQKTGETHLVHLGKTSPCSSISAKYTNSCQRPFHSLTYFVERSARRRRLIGIARQLWGESSLSRPSDTFPS